VLPWSGWRHIEGRPPLPRFRTIQVCPKDLASALRQAEHAAYRPQAPRGAFLKDQFGLTIAPAFTAFFDHLTEIVIANRDAIVEFGQILGSLLKPWKELPSS
jgi:hypothetical protein